MKILVIGRGRRVPNRPVPQCKSRRLQKRARYCLRTGKMQVFGITFEQGRNNFKIDRLSASGSFFPTAADVGETCLKLVAATMPVFSLISFTSDPLPTFEGEPERVIVPNDLKAFASEIWNSLNEADACRSP